MGSWSRHLGFFHPSMARNSGSPSSLAVGNRDKDGLGIRGKCRQGARKQAAKFFFVEKLIDPSLSSVVSLHWKSFVHIWGSWSVMDGNGLFASKQMRDRRLCQKPNQNLWKFWIWISTCPQQNPFSKAGKTPKIHAIEKNQMHKNEQKKRKWILEMDGFLGTHDANATSEIA